MLTGVLMVVLVRTFGYGTAWITDVSTVLLSFFLVPDKECMLMYVLFVGYYTIVRQWIGRLRPRSVALAAECLLFNAAPVSYTHLHSQSPCSVASASCQFCMNLANTS